MFGLLDMGTNGYPPLMLGYPTHGKNKTQRENNEQYFDCFCNFCDLFLNTFEWINLPDTCNALALERVLLFEGKCLFFEHKQNGGLYHCAFNFDGTKMNFYGEFTKYRTNAPTYRQHEYNNENAIVIRNTPCMFPSWITLDIYAKKIYDNQRILDVYQKTSKRPFLISGSKEQVISIEKILEGADTNEYYKILNKNAIDAQSFQVFPITQDPNMLYAMWDNLHNNQDELNKRLGIKTARTDKAERMITAEATSADMITESNINIMLDCRRKACEEINNMFGTNISCKIKHAEEKMDNEVEVNEDE